MPPICTHKLRNLVVGDQSMCRSPVLWVLSSPKDSGPQGGDGGTESGSLCPNLGRFDCDDKDSLIADPAHERNARAAA